MDISLTIYNYRSFGDADPARVKIRKGFVAFTGVNNAGKSNLIRFLYEFRGLFSNALNGELRNAMRETRGFTFPNTVADRSEVFHNGNSRDLRFELEFDYYTAIPEHAGGPRAGTRLFAEFLVPRDQAAYQLRRVEGRGPGGEGKLSQDHFERFSPGLLEVLRLLSNTLYIGAFRNAINVGTKDNYYDLQIGQSFITSWRELKSGSAKRKNEAALDIMEQIRRIFQLSKFDVNPTPNTENIQLFADGKSYLLSEQGSGLSQFLLVLANVAEKRPALVLIDEPELNLHPSLQLDFLTTLASYASFGVLFATHSVGLARAAGQIVYCAYKKDGASHVREMGDVREFSEFLQQLVFGGFPDLRFQKVLLVEGPSDVVVFQQFLRLYGKDHEFVLLPLGGSTVINAHPDKVIEEIKRIAPDRVSAVIDSEITDPDRKPDAEREKFKAICDAANVPCHILERRATENYFPARAIKKILGEKYEPLGQFEPLKKAKLGWDKGDNWRMAREMTREELEATDLGKFILKLVS
jgi:energy-coupling factor transporter ATP-binding protein EcfA2